MDKPLQQVISEKSELLHNIIAHKFGQNPSATASGGQETNTGGGNAMKVTRSATSGVPGEVQDGKLVDVKQLASAAARQDVPPTDLLALARANDPHNEETIPTTIAGAVSAQAEPISAQAGNKALGDLEKTQKEMLSQKQHPAALDAVQTDVKSQTSDGDPYKTLHASDEIDQIVQRAKKIMSGAEEIKRAATEVKDNPGAGEVEGHPSDPAGGDAAKNAQDSAQTLSSAKSGKDLLAAIRSEIKRRRAKVEGHPVDPAKGEDADKTPAESADTLGDGGATEKKAEAKDRPVTSMPEGKHRYDKDKDPRDEIAESYWSKAKADEKRWSAEEKADRPLTRKTQEKMPRLAPKAERRRQLLTRLAGLSVVLAASEEAERLRLQRKTYSKDEAKDMDFEGAASRTQKEIAKEQAARENDTHTFSPMMSRLWAAYGPVKTAADTGYKGKLATPEGKAELRKQIEEMRTALKGLGAESQGSEGQMQAMQSKIESMEAELSKSSGVNVGAKGLEVMASAFERLSAVAEALRDVSDVCAASHIELRFAADKEMGGLMDKTRKLLEDLGETAEDMVEEIDDALSDLKDKKGPPKPKEKDEPKDEKKEEKGDEGDEKGPPEPKESPLPPKGEAADPAPGLPPGLMAGADKPVKTAAEVEEEAVEKIAQDSSLKPGEKTAKIEEARRATQWKAQFTKVASKDDPTKADIRSSFWEVLRNGETVLKATVAELYPVKTASEQEAAFAWCATKDYGRKLLSSVKYEGLGKTAKLLGLAPMVRSAANGKVNEKSYYSEAFGSPEYASELLKDHEKRHRAEVEALNQRLAQAEAKAAAEKERNDRLQRDLSMRAKAERALRLANQALAKGLFGEDKKASFIDTLMQGDDAAFKATAQIVENFTPTAVGNGNGGEHKEAGKTTARELIRMAQAAPGLKTPIVMESKPSAPFTGLQEQLSQMWRKPPTAQ